MPAAKDLTGEKFGRLTAIERLPEHGKQTKYKCLCDCGVVKIIQTGHLTSGATKSCGCLSSETTALRNVKSKGKRSAIKSSDDLTGKRFGRLIVRRYRETNKDGKRLWDCLCDCGNSTTVIGSHIRNGYTASCGCLQREAASNAADTHGCTSSLEYGPWCAMWQRCTNPNHEKYHLYKNRRPPEEWKNFLCFLADMGPRPSPEHSIERIKNDLPYGPGNCKWATPKEQARNTSATRMIDYQGTVMSLPEACNAAGFDYAYIHARLSSIGGIERASKGLFKEAKYADKNFL